MTTDDPKKKLEDVTVIVPDKSPGDESAGAAPQSQVVPDAWLSDSHLRHSMAPASIPDSSAPASYAPGAQAPMNRPAVPPPAAPPIHVGQAPRGTVQKSNVPGALPSAPRSRTGDTGQSRVPGVAGSGGNTNPGLVGRPPQGGGNAPQSRAPQSRVQNQNGPPPSQMARGAQRPQSNAGLMIAVISAVIVALIGAIGMKLGKSGIKELRSRLTHARSELPSVRKKLTEDLKANCAASKYADTCNAIIQQTFLACGGVLTTSADYKSCLDDHLALGTAEAMNIGYLFARPNGPDAPVTLMFTTPSGRLVCEGVTPKQIIELKGRGPVQGRVGRFIVTKPPEKYLLQYSSFDDCEGVRVPLEKQGPSFRARIIPRAPIASAQCERALPFDWEEDVLDSLLNAKILRTEGGLSVYEVEEAAGTVKVVLAKTFEDCQAGVLSPND